MGVLTEEMKEELKNLCGTVLYDEPMLRYTSIRIGGNADALIYPKNIDEVTSLVGFAKKRRLPLFLLGAGSNLLVRDKGIRGLVVSLSQGFVEIRIEESNLLYAEAGVGMPRLVDFAAEKGLSGLEPLAGIPGNLGGSLVMNAGTHEGEISDVVHSVSFIDKEGRLMTWKKEQIDYDYRASHFPKSAVVLSARLQLKSSTSEEIRKKVSLSRETRVKTQPLNVPNLGSVFKNPDKGFAGALIEETGLKNVRVGGARISSKHGNFIVNEGKATAKDVLALVGLIRDKVKERHGVLLQTEVKVVGEE